MQCGLQPFQEADLKLSEFAFRHRVRERALSQQRSQLLDDSDRVQYRVVRRLGRIDHVLTACKASTTSDETVVKARAEASALTMYLCWTRQRRRRIL